MAETKRTKSQKKKDDLLVANFKIKAITLREL
jgi:hypothetical protein